ncbi:TniB family NTP-binding protein [Variovorax sp. RB3P1]|uniref:TniB family NTP-binding protein n=1 Tax=Variovorax sp. RB3P1 TaxID=3443732 RepID=UPI003F46A673
MGDAGAILNRARWKGVDIEIRLRDFQSCLVYHPDLTGLIDEIRHRSEVRKLTRKGHGIRVIAGSDRGKSTTIGLLKRMMPPQITETRTRYPLLTFDIAGNCSPKGIYDSLKIALNAPVAHYKTERKYRESILLLMDEEHADVQILAIDNIQDVPERWAKKGINVVGNVIRDIAEENDLILLLFGTKEIELIVENNGQLRRRAPAKMELCAHDISTVDGMYRALELVREFEKHLPLAEESDLANRRSGKALICATDGGPGAMKSLLAIAVIICVKAGREKVIGEDLKIAYSRLYAGFENCNPFDEKFTPWRRLNRPGEPHYDAAEWMALCKIKEKKK